MHRTTSATLAVSLFLPLLAHAGAHGEAQKYRLRELSAAGDVSVNENTSGMELDFSVSVDDRQVRSATASRTREQYTENILGERKDVTTFRRAYSAHRSSEIGPDGKLVTQVSSLQGKTLTLRIADGKPSITAASARTLAEDRKKLLSDLSDRSPFFPDRELGPGDEWTPEWAKFADSFKGADKVVAKARFADVVEWGGHRCARITLEMELHGKPNGAPFTMEMKATGTAYYALDIQRGLQFELSGPATLSGDLPIGNGQTGKVEGTGYLFMKMTTRWQKIAGKPVPATKYPASPERPFPPPRKPQAPRRDEAATPGRVRAAA